MNPSTLNKRVIVSEADTPDGEGFVHITTMLIGDEVVTQIAQYRYDRVSPSDWETIEHPPSRWPSAIALRISHEHLLATRQELFRSHAAPYWVQVTSSLWKQIASGGLQLGRDLKAK